MTCPLRSRTSTHEGRAKENTSAVLDTAGVVTEGVADPTAGTPEAGAEAAPGVEAIGVVETGVVGVVGAAEPAPPEAAYALSGETP